uniref:Uncharacterized protein n=1 Tax=Anguilla anguilla TaxID=7936 RepID=A0A0E9RGC2_ANGAN
MLLRAESAWLSLYLIRRYAQEQDIHPYTFNINSAKLFNWLVRRLSAIKPKYFPHFCQLTTKYLLPSAYCLAPTN